MKRTQNISAILKSPAMTSSSWQILAVALACTVYLYFNLFTLQGLPQFLGGDQVYFWTGAQQLLDGQTPYRDFFQYTTPGSDLIFAAFFKVFGADIWVTNAVVLALGVSSACVAFSLSRKLMRVEMAALCTAFYLVLIYGRALNATHHWFAAIFILLAIGACMEKVDSKRIAASGALLGLAAFFNQAHGAAALIGFAVFLLCRGIRIGLAPIHVVRLLALLFAAFSLVLVPSLAYYVATAGPQRVWYCLVTAVSEYLRQYSPPSLGIPYRTLTWRDVPGAASYLSVYILLPIVYGLSLWRCWRLRKTPSFPWDRIALLSLVGLSLLLEIAVSVNWLRLFAISPPGIILAVWMVRDLPARHRLVFLAASIVICGVAIHQVIAKHLVSNASGELPGGRFVATPQIQEKMSWLAEHTREGEFLFQSGWPSVYVPLKLRNPLYFPSVGRPDGVRDQDVERIIQQLEAKQVRYVLWPHHLDEDCKSNPCNDYLFQLRAYLNSSYTLARTFSDGDALWLRSGASTFDRR